MKKILPTLCLLALACLARAGQPPEIFFNGLVTLFGDKRVLFKTDAGTAAEQSFFLAEGESRLGIRLISVDTASATALFDNHGTLQKISICPTPHPAAATVANGQGRQSNPPSAAGAGGFAGQSDSISASSDPAGQSVNETFSGGGSAGKSPTGSAESNTSSGQDQPASPQNSWWYRGAQQMEAARLATADAVQRGELPPYPLTPLTPPGTATALIGPDRLYFNHFERQF